MGATLTGVPLYQARGYVALENLEVPLAEWRIACLSFGWKNEWQSRFLGSNTEGLFHRERTGDCRHHAIQLWEVPSAHYHALILAFLRPAGESAMDVPQGLVFIFYCSWPSSWSARS